MSAAGAQPSVDLPMGVRVELMHAFLQSVADEAGIDLLHVKGPALDVSLLQRGAHGEPMPRHSTDADVLVRPADAERLLSRLREHGCHQRTRYRSGSPFEHAANVWHDELGHADVHRHFPGIGLRPATAFETLWSRRHEVTLAHWPCAVPHVDDQRLLLLLHAARSEGTKQLDVDQVWGRAGEVDRERVRSLAEELDATVALAAAIGELDDYRHHPEYALWKQFSGPEAHSRTDEWRARLRAARTPWQAASVMVRALQVNTDRMRLDLGREPTREEIAAKRRERLHRALRERFGGGR
ncbi:nucleotidyltransferase family protein [Propionibacteriaceae bacterium G1746]